MALFEILNPKRIIAIGGDAYESLNSMGIDCEYVRHPSYGGQKDFLSGMASLLNLQINKVDKTNLPSIQLSMQLDD
jgi:hypothetical protein